MKSKSALLKTIVLVVLAALISLPVCAQPNVDSITREVDHSAREKAEKEMVTPPKKAAVKEEEEKKAKRPEGPKFFVKTIQLTGPVSFPPEAFSPIVKKYENKEINLNDLDELATEIEKEYLKKGIIAACFVPPQGVKKDTVTLQVVEPKMGTLEIRDVEKSWFFDNDSLDFYWDIKPGKVLRYDKMSRSLQLMNKNPDRKVNANLRAGKEHGTTDILLESKTRFPIHPFVSFDTEGVPSTGLDRTGLGIRHNNFLFVDDTLLAGSMFGKDFTGFYAYHSVPITNFGTTVMYGYSDSKARPKKEYTRFGIDSRVQSGSVFVYQDIYDRANYVGVFSAGLDMKDKVTTTIADGTLNRDRLRILRLQCTFVNRDFGGVTSISPQFSQGLNILGAQRKNPLSSRDAENTLTKFNLSLRHRRPLPFGLGADLRFKAQLAGDKLPPLEQYFLGGIDSVRGYPSGDFLADNTVQVNAELLIPAFFIPETINIPFNKKPLKDSIKGVIFFDYGYGRLLGASNTEKSKVNFAGIGPGIRIRLFDRALVRLAWGFVVGDKPLTETANSRFHISVNFEL